MNDINTHLLLRSIEGYYKGSFFFLGRSWREGIVTEGTKEMIGPCETGGIIAIESFVVIIMESSTTIERDVVQRIEREFIS